MLGKQNQGSRCTACGSPMRLSAIEASNPGQDLRTFTCPRCRRLQRQNIESAVTDAWIELPRAISVRCENAVTYEIHDGRMIPKAAK
jgi:hypothetical protein